MITNQKSCPVDIISVILQSVIYMKRMKNKYNVRFAEKEANMRK
jgi:hypothetical protein